MERIVVLLTNGESVTVEITAEQQRTNALVRATDASDYLEASVQLMEGYTYEYVVVGDDTLGLRAAAGVVKPFSGKSYIGRITPGNYVGTLSLDVTQGEMKLGEFALEVRSYKASYRKDYQHMLSYITERCTEIVLQHSSPVTQSLTFNYVGDAQTLYQRFAFVRSLIESDEFDESVHRILTMPVNSWRNREEQVDIRRAGKIGSGAIKAFAKGSKRISLPQGRIRDTLGVSSLPSSVPKRQRYATVDTPENRFVLFVLSAFQHFCADVCEKLQELGSKKEAEQAKQAVDRLEGWLDHSIFKEVGFPTTIPLNSPVLQRKEGYREVLRAWLMFDLASKLVWKAGDDIYSAGKRDVAKLYEYWVFFKLLDIFSDKFRLDHKPIEELIKPSDSGLSLALIEGEHTAISGVYERKSRKLNVDFSFNRSFAGKQSYPNGGSWTKSMRPDYTLSLWPIELTAMEAEKAELIVHVHFDAKYKIDKVKRWLESDNETEEKQEKIIGSFKREDLLKMHAYKDAIRRTGGAYVLYPGEESWHREGFHEILPGLGAFPLRPSSENDGSKDLIGFVDEVINHLLNRASQREKASYHNYQVHKSGKSDSLHEPIPELYGNERAEPVDETSVLIGFYKPEQLPWIENRGFYNARTGTKAGSLDLGPLETGAKYLLLHGKNELVSSKLYSVIGHKEGKTGPRVWSTREMANSLYYSDTGYEFKETADKFYVVYKLSSDIPEELRGISWDISKLKSYSFGRQSALPFAVTLKDLMRAREI